MSPPVYRLGLGIAIAALFLTASSASAQITYTWTGASNPASNLWTNGANWNRNGTPDGLAPYFDQPNIVVRLAGNTQTTNVIDDILAAVRLEYAANAGNFTTSASGTGQLLLTGGITVENGASAQTLNFNAPIRIDAAQTWSVGDNRTLSVGGIVSSNGTFALTKTGNGTLTLTQANTYNGVTNINAGIVRVTSANGLGNAGAGNQTVLAAGASLQVTNGITIPELLTINGDGISSGGSIVKDGNNNTQLSGAVTLNTSTRFTSNTAGGTLTFTGGLTGTDTNLVFGGPGNHAVNSAISIGAGTITKEGTGTGNLTLGGANTYTGVTTVSTGSLTITNSGALGAAGAASNTIVASGAALVISGGTVASGEDITIGGTGLSNSGAIRSTAGTNTLSGAITLTAATRINTDAGSLTISGGIAGAFDLMFGGTGNTGNTIVSGIIATTGANGITKDGPGTLTLSGANTFTGSATVSGGVLRFENALAIPGAGRTVTASFGGTVATGFGTGVQAGFLDRIVQTSGGVIALATSTDVTEPLNFTGFTSARLGAALGTSPTYSGTLTPDGTTYRLGGGGGTLTVSSNLVDVGGMTSLNVDLNGTPVTSVVVLSGTNTFTGPTTVNGGVLRYNSLNAMGLGGDGSITVGPSGAVAAGFALDAPSAATFLARINTGSAGVIALTSNTTINLDFDTPNLTVRLGALGGTDAAPIVYSGTITPEGAYRLGGGTGVLSVSQPLTAAGGLDVGVTGVPGTVILTAANTFTGGVTINGGNLRLGNVNALNGNLVTFSAGSTGTLQLNGNSITLAGLTATTTAPAVENANATAATLTLNVDSGSVSYSGAIRDGTGGGVLSIIKTGAGTQILAPNSTTAPTNSSTYTGTTTINGGVLVASTATALGGTGGNTTVNAGAALQVTGAITIAEPLVLNGTGIANDGALRKTGSNTTTLSGAITINSATRINSDANTLTLSGAIGAGANPLTVGGAGATTISGVLTISGTLAHDSASVLTLSANNSASITGPISVSAGGVLAFPSINGLGTNASLPAITLDNGTLRNTATAATNFVTPNRDIVLAAGGGTLEWGSTTAVATIAAGTTISGAGNLTKIGAGAIVIAEPATYTGATNVNAGILRAGAANVFAPNSAVILANTAGVGLELNNFNQSIPSLAGGGATGGNVALGTATLTLSGIGSTSYAGVISGTGGLTKSGTGTQTLTAVNTYSGATTVTGGTLAIATGGALDAASAVAVNGGTLAGTGTVNGAVTVGAGGQVRGDVLGGLGTLTLNNNVTVATGGMLTPEVNRTGTGTATTSLIALTGTGVLNLSNGFVINLQNNATNPMLLGETYTITVANVASGTINVNGSPVTGEIPRASYTITATNAAGFGYMDNVHLMSNAGVLSLTFTPVPEPATVLGLAAGTLALGGLVRRRLRRTTTETVA